MTFVFFKWSVYSACYLPTVVLHHSLSHPFLYSCGSLNSQYPFMALAAATSPVKNFSPLILFNNHSFKEGFSDLSV